MSAQTIRNDTWYYGVWLFFNDMMLITSLFVITIMLAFDLNFLKDFWVIDSFFDYMTLIVMISSFFIQYETMEIIVK